MDRLAILVLLIITASYSTLSHAASTACDKDKNSEACKAYISGLVDGYIASKQKYIPTKPNYDSKFLERVYASRVNKAQYNSEKPRPACLPEDVDKLEAVKHLIHTETGIKLTTELGNYLRANYPCEGR